MEHVVRVARSASQMPASAKAEEELTLEEGRLVVRGDSSGARRWLVHVGPEMVTLATGWHALSKALGNDFHLRPDGAALLLRCSFVPVPYTLFADTYQAGIGDVLSIELASGTVEYAHDFPFLIARSRQSEVWDSRTFTDLLCASCEHFAAEPAVLLLSAGKDSTAVLLALHRIGRKEVVCVTYDARYREQEAAPAGSLARSLGFRHVTVSADPRAEFEAYVAFLRSTPHLTLDFALPATLAVVAEAAQHGSILLDGLGNDKYMHCTPSRRERFLRAMSLPSRLNGAGWRVPTPSVFGKRAAYALSSVTMYGSERWFPGMRLPAGLIDHVTGAAPAAHAFAQSLDHDLRGRHVVDAVTIAKGRYSDYSGAMEKTRLAAEHLGLTARSPFCDHDLIDYYFNLPNRDRFDHRTCAAKIAFKRWLVEQPVRSEYFSIKGSFRYYMPALFDVNHHEIMDMMMRSPNIEFNPSLRTLFNRARFGYFQAQQAYLIFSLVVWSDAHGFTLKGDSGARLKAHF